MARYIEVLLAVTCVVAVVESKPQTSLVNDAAKTINSVFNGFFGTRHGTESTTSAPVTVKVEEKQAIGVSVSGTAERPTSASIHPAKSRPTVDDVIHALQNLSQHLSKQPSQQDSEREQPTPDVTTPNLPPQEYPTVSATYPSPPIDPTTPKPYPLPAYPQPAVDPSSVVPVYPPQQPINNPNRDYYPDYATPGPIIPNPFDNKTNQSIVIINFNDLAAQYGGMTITQLLNILTGKPGFVYVIQPGGQGQLIPLNQLHLIPQNSIPAYIVLLIYGQPNLALNPGLQPTNGLLPFGNLGYLVSTFGGLGSLPVYIANGYYPIWTILSNLGIYYPEYNGNFNPNNRYPTSYNNLPTSFSTPVQPSVAVSMPQPPINPPTDNKDLVGLLQVLGQKPSGDFGINREEDEGSDVSDSELIKLLLQVLNEKPGSRTEDIIIRDRKNPTNLLRTIIELLGRKLGSNNVVIASENENNPSKLLQILIDLLRRENQSVNVFSQNNDRSISKLIKLLMGLISKERDQTQYVVNDTNQLNLVNILMQLLNDQPQLRQVLLTGDQMENPSKLIQVLQWIMQKLPNISADPGNSIFRLRDSSGSSSIDMNKLVQILQVLLKQQESLNPSIILQDREPMLTGGSGVNSNILSTFLKPGSNRGIQTALWSYLLGYEDCTRHQGRRTHCSK